MALLTLSMPISTLTVVVPKQSVSAYLKLVINSQIYLKKIQQVQYKSKNVVNNADMSCLRAL